MQPITSKFLPGLPQATALPASFTPPAMPAGANEVRPAHPLVDRPRSAGPDRTKLWDLDTSLHCSTVGTCITTGELRSLFRKFHAGETDSLSDHDLHALAVSAARKRTPFSKQLQKALDRRHKPVLTRFAKARSAEDVLGLWKEAMGSGEIPGAYWAVLMHPKSTDTVLRRVFGDVHMLSHLVGSANRADLKRLHAVETENAALHDKLARQQDHLHCGFAERDARIRELSLLLSERIERSHRSSESAPRAGVQPPAIEQLIADLQKALVSERKRRERAEQRALAAEEANGGYKRDAAAKEGELAALRAELAAVEAEIGEARTGAADAAAALDLSGVTILYAGGRPQQIVRMRAVVDRASGQLLHHDGGIEDSEHLLPGLVHRADIVLFPVDCISHGATQTLKRLSSQAGKPFLPLRSAGLGSFLRALRQRSRMSGTAA